VVKTKKLDIPEDWEVEEVTEEEKTGWDSKKLWAVFIVVVIAFAALTLMSRPEPERPTNVYVNGVRVSGVGNPIEKIRMIRSLNLVGKAINENQSAAEKNGLLEIGEILKTTSPLKIRGSGYEVRIGITDREGIFLDKTGVNIEGTGDASLWRAVWVFSSLISDTTIKSTVDFWSVQDLFLARENVSIVVDQENYCPKWSDIIISTTNIVQSLGFQQGRTNFTIYQFLRDGDACSLHFSSPTRNLTSPQCPEASEGSYVILLKRGDENAIGISGDGMEFYYSDCDSMVRGSLILRDMIAPDVLTAFAGFGNDF
jgi:hypothetical protein